jgi:transposase
MLFFSRKTKTIMQNFEIFVGIDVSKEHLDFAVFNSENRKTAYMGRCKSTYEEMGAMVKKIGEKHKKKTMLFCMETTGDYSEYVAFYLHQEGFSVWVENALHIKRSFGLVRGKDDKIDSERISEYAFRHADKFSAYTPPSEPLCQLRRLQNLRDNMVESRKRLTTQLKEAKRYSSKENYALLRKHSEELLATLNESIAGLEKEILQVIENEPSIKKNFDLVGSVPGVGFVTTTALIVATNNFTAFDDAKKLACYCGVAPFGNSSGKTVGRKRVSIYANKHLKSLLHMCVTSILSTKKGELYAFYLKKLAEGKPTLVAMNALRNKLIHRIYACVKKGVPYDPNYKQEFPSGKKTVIVDSAMAKKTHGGGQWFAKIDEVLTF